MNTKNKILNFLIKNKKKILSKNFKYNLNEFKKGKKDIDFNDSDKILRNQFEQVIKNQNVINLKRYHRTGLRYDVIDEQLNVYSLDFLNGIETHPLFFNFYPKSTNSKKKIKHIKFNFSNLIKLSKNSLNYLVWRIFSILKQKPTIIEIFGVDGSGKSFLSNKIYLKLKKNINTIKVHLWKNISITKNKKIIIPYQKKNFSFFLSQLKELYLLFRLICFFLIINISYKRKCVYISERSCWDIIIDPERYRMRHKPYLILFFLRFIMNKTHKILILRNFNFINSNKGELNFNQFNKLNSNLIKFFKKEKNFIKIY